MLIKRGLFLALFMAGVCHASDSAIADIATVRNGAATFTSLQATYAAAATGDTVQSRAITFNEGLDLNRAIDRCIKCLMSRG
jgi:hypothetical protein